MADIRLKLAPPFLQERFPFFGVKMFIIFTLPREIFMTST